MPYRECSFCSQPWVNHTVCVRAVPEGCGDVVASFHSGVIAWTPYPHLAEKWVSAGCVVQPRRRAGSSLRNLPRIPTFRSTERDTLALWSCRPCGSLENPRRVSRAGLGSANGSRRKPHRLMGCCQGPLVQIHGIFHLSGLFAFPLRFCVSR